MPVFESTLASASSMLNYLSPTKSPFYLITSFSCFGLIQGLTTESEIYNYYIFSLGVILAVSLYLVLRSRVAPANPSQTASGFDDYEPELKFARSVVLAAAVISFIAIFSKLNKLDGHFWLFFVPFVIQIGLFLFYSYLVTTKDEKELPGRFNFLQLSLITTIYFLANTYLISINPDSDLTFESRHLRLSTFFLLMWGICINRWIQHIRKIVKFYIVYEDANTKQIH